MRLDAIRGSKRKKKYVRQLAVGWHQLKFMR